MGEKPGPPERAEVTAGGYWKEQEEENEDQDKSEGSTLTDGKALWLAGVPAGALGN